MNRYDKEAQARWLPDDAWEADKAAEAKALTRWCVGAILFCLVSFNVLYGIADGVGRL